MRKYLFIIFQFAFVLLTQAQTSGLGGPLPVLTPAQLKNVDKLNDSLHPLLQGKDDTTKINLLLLLASAYHSQMKRDSSFWYNQQALKLSQKLNYERGLFDAQHGLADLFRQAGNYPKALQLTLINLPISEQYKDTLRLSFTLMDLCGINNDLNDFVKQLAYAQRLQKVMLSGYFKRHGDTRSIQQLSFPYLINLALAYDGLNKRDSALYYLQHFYKLALSSKDTSALTIATGNLSDVLLKLGQYNEAQSSYQMAINYAKASGRPYWIANSYLGLSKIFQQKNQLDSALNYAKLSLSSFQRLKLPAFELKAASLLDELYTTENQLDSAHRYLTLAVRLKDSLFNQEKVKQIQNLQFTETLRQQQIEQERKEAQQQYETKLKIYSLVGGLTLLLLIAYFLYRNNRQKQKANVVLHQKNEEIQNTLAELKSTQAQLIQQEKMASLGELTAGIAHEIQNPLNFVNNFSEVNKELLVELNEEIEKENFDEVKAIAKDVIDNEEKINHHGKRADAIVKGMLQHSRVSTGQKEPTDINALADEYLRLSYHGMRAKDKSFNAEIKTDFDPTLSADEAGIGKINIVPQDIGRVLLNLFNNAFYAVMEKNKNLSGQESYVPAVTIATQKLNDKIEIKVADNGTGIPQKVVDKIFQPFFTTKPTGQGTGLGLSLSYDIIKAHGGEIKVETKEGEGSEFVIQLSVK